MRVKSYFSGTVEAALAQGRRELGDEALLLKVRPAPLEARALGAYEVVLGIEERMADRSVPATARRVLRLPEAGPPPPSPATNAQRPAEVTDLERFLVDRGFDPWMARDLCGLRDWSAASPEELRRELTSRLRTGAAIGPDPPLLALVGPPGTGKTTAVMKLAVRLGQHYRRPALVIDSDCRRIGASEQLRRLTELAGIHYRHAADPAALPALAAEVAGKRPVLIDTPGFAPAELEDARPWAAALANISSLECVLTVMATTHSADLLLAIRRYAFLAPTGLLFTRLDEASAGGSMISAALQSGLPVRWVAAGPMIPEDLAEATAAALCERLLGADEPVEARAAGSGR